MLFTNFEEINPQKFSSSLFGSRFEFEDAENCQPQLNGENYVYQKPLGMLFREIYSKNTVTKMALERRLTFGFQRALKKIIRSSQFFLS